MTWKKRTSQHTPIRVETAAQVSMQTQTACAHFGLIPRNSSDRQQKTTTPTDRMRNQILNNDIILITGYSGAGKSCLLRGISESLKDHRVHIVSSQPIQSPLSIFDLLTGTLKDRLATLSHAGLAEPKLWARPFNTLSGGEQARFQLALTMQHARSGDFLVADEFCTPLDRISAHAIATTLRRWALRNHITLIVATAHEDMKSLLCPSLVIDASTDASHTLPPTKTVPAGIHIERGTIKDYQSLAHLHYRGPKPATHTLVLRAMRSFPRTMPNQDPILAGVLVVSMPTLNGSWRELAWPGHFSGQSKTENAHRINRDLRCISRVITDPRSRGLGVASSLVRAYLSNPQTPATESIAAMGFVCPFLKRAGMTQYTLVASKDDLRLLDTLHHEQRTPNDLINHPIEPGSLLARELLRWGKSRKIITPQTEPHEALQIIAPIAACRLISKPRAYAHVFSQGATRDEFRDG